MQKGQKSSGELVHVPSLAARASRCKTSEAIDPDPAAARTCLSMCHLALKSCHRRRLNMLHMYMYMYMYIPIPVPIHIHTHIHI